MFKKRQPDKLILALQCLIAALLISGCTVSDIIPGNANERTSDIGCTPIDPLDETLPSRPCFFAYLTDRNEVTLQWRVVNSKPSVYIFDDSGPNYNDIGYKPAVCESGYKNSCTTSLRVGVGGFFRWQLQVEHPDGHKIHVPAALTIIPPYPPVVENAHKFVDQLTPLDVAFSWIADQRNAPLDASIDHAWIEVRMPGEFFFREKHMPRSGPDANLQIPFSALNAQGNTTYNVRDCIKPSGAMGKFCSSAVPVVITVDSDSFTTTTPLYTNNQQDLTLSFTTLSGDVRRLQSETLIRPDNAQEFLETTKDSYTIDAGLLTPGSHQVDLSSCLVQSNVCSAKKTLRIYVNSPLSVVTWELDREYLKDFNPAVPHTALGSGEPLDITYDITGGIWMINEHSNNIEHVSPLGVVQSFTIPLARKPGSPDLPSETVRPFAISIYGNKHPASFSTLAERAMSIDTKIWFTQGGGMLDATEARNRSRVISFDLSQSDSPATRYDDRICVYNIPAEDTESSGNNQVIGLTATAGRVWIGESRSFFTEDSSVISYFIPDPASCDNLFNFDDPQALESQKLQYCLPGRTPEQDRCIQQFSFDELPGGIKVAHLETDPVNDSVWFTDVRGGYLGNIDINREQVFKLYPLPETNHHTGTKGQLGFGGFPWSLRADENAVYISEYSTSHLLRFDKATATFHEIYVPSTTPLHSIDLDHTTNRLWFTLTNEGWPAKDRAASTIGYIDLASWQDHVADSSNNTKIYGVIYAGLDGIANSKLRPGHHQSFRGIAIDLATGKIALATMWRKQFTELSPNAAFWP